MKYRTLLLVGGTNAGGKITLKEGVNYCTLLELERREPFDVTQGRQDEQKPLMHEGYRVESLSDGKRDYEVLVCAGVNLLQELINGYRPVTPTDGN